MAVEILGGALVLMTAVAIHGSFRISSLRSTIRDIEKWAHRNEINTAKLEQKLAVSEETNRSLASINRDLRAELDRTHAALNAQIEIASSNLADASKWRNKVAHLRNVAASGGRAMHAKKKSKQAAMTKQLRCEIARNANDSAVEA